jgi:hypothetical protein
VQFGQSKTQQEVKQRVAKLKKGLKKKMKSGRSIEETQVQPVEARAHLLFLARERHELAPGKNQYRA